MKPNPFSIAALIRHALDPSAPEPLHELQDGKFHDAELARAVAGPNGPSYPGSPHVVPFDTARDLTAATASSLIGEEPGTLIDLLRAKTLSTRIGVQTFTGLKGDLPFPIITGESAAAFKAEGVAAAQAAATTTKLTGQPKRLTGWFYISQKLITTGGPVADLFIQNQLASSARRVLDKAVFFGAGAASDEPQGITGTAGVGSVDALNLDWDRLIEFETDVTESDADGADADSEMFYVLRPSDRAILKKRERITGQPKYLCNEDNVLNGYRSIASTAITAGRMFFGNFTQVYILIWGNGIPLMINPYSLDKERMVKILFDLYCDVVVTKPAAISMCTNLS